MKEYYLKHLMISCKKQNNFHLSQTFGDLWNVFFLCFTVPSKINRSNLQTSFSIIQNQTVYLNCPVTGSPQPSITWLKNSIPMLDFPYKDLRVLNRDQRLEISNAQVEDAGKYTCRASNVAGSDKQHFELEVKGEWTVWDDSIVQLWCHFQILPDSWCCCLNDTKLCTVIVNKSTIFYKMNKHLSKMWQC